MAWQILTNNWLLPSSCELSCGFLKAQTSTLFIGDDDIMNLNFLMVSDPLIFGDLVCIKLNLFFQLFPYVNLISRPSKDPWDEGKTSPL